MKDLTLKIIINAVIDNARAGLAATQQHINAVKERVSQLIGRVDAATAQFVVFASIAINAMGQASAAAIALGGHVLSLTTMLFRMAQGYLGLSVHIDTHNTKLKAANFLLNNFHKEIRLSLGGLGTFADYLDKINFPLPKLTQFIDGLSKAEIVLGIGRGKEKNLFDHLPESIDAARDGVRRFQEAFKNAKDDIQRDLKRFGAAAMAEVVVEWRGVKFESAFADVKKTVSGTADGIKRLRGELLDMAANIALPTDGLAKMQAIAGQMGFPVKEISDFVKLTAKGAVAFEILPEQAAESFGTLKNIYSLGLKELEYFGDQINYIADKAGGKVSESALLNVLTRAGGVAQRFGLLRGETVALGAAMLAMGKPPEIVGTAMDNLLSKLQNAPNQSKDFQIGLQQLGFDAVKLADDIEKNPKKALDGFLTTLSKLDARSQSDILTKLIGDAGETKGVIGDLIGNLAEYNRLSALANAGDIGGSMDATFIERQKTVEAALIMLKNAWDGVAVSISTMFLPTIRFTAEALRDLAVWLRKVNDEYPNLTSFARIALIFGTLGTVMKLAFRALPGIAAGAGQAVALAFRSGIVNGVKSLYGVIVPIVATLWSSVIGQFVIKLVAGAAIIQIGLSNVLGVIGALTSALATLVSSPVALAVASLGALAVRLGVAGSVLVRLGVAASGLGAILLRLVGGPIGLVISTLAFLIVKYNEVKDQQIQFGGSTVTLAEIIDAAWSLIKGAFADSVVAASGALDWLGGKWNGLWQGIETKMGGLSWLTNGFKNLANAIIGVFNGLGKRIGVSLAIFVEEIKTGFKHAASLAEAAARDIKAAFTDFDFSGRNFSEQRATNQQENRAIEQRRGDSPRMDALVSGFMGAYKGDAVGTLAARVGEEFQAGFDATGQAITDQVGTWQDQLNAEIMRNRINNGRAAASPPPETRKTGGAGLAGADNPDAYAALYRAAEQKYRLPPYLVQAVAKVESDNGNNAGLSPAGALGHMQLMPETAKALGVTDRANDAQSIEGGAKLLRELLDTFNNDVNLALAAYNSRPKTVKQAAGDFGKLPQETQRYVPNVLAELDKLQNNTKGAGLAEQFNVLQTLIKNQRDAVGVAIESRIDNRLKTAEATADDTIQTLEHLKDQGKIGINDYYKALTDQQEAAVKANIEAVKARLAENQRLRDQAQLTAKPEELPTLNAGFDAKKESLTTDLQALQLKLAQIKPANLIDQDKEQQALNDVVNQVKVKLAELRGETANDPIAIKAKLELENADLIAKLKQAGQGELAGQYLNTLSANEQADVIQSDIGTVQQRTQAKETRINLLQQSGTITQFHAQQELKQLYQDSADELDAMADKLSELGDNTGLEDLKAKALDAKNAAGQLRVTLPSLSTQFIDAGQNAAISSMTDNIIGLANGTEKAGQAFTNFGLSVVKALQQIAAEKLAKQVIGTVIDLAGAAFGGSGGSSAGASTGSSGGGFWSAGGAQFGSSAYAQGGLITGPGTGTSDSIESAMSPGTFILKAAAVKKVGLPALDAIVKLASDQHSGKVPVKVSSGEYEIPPSIVAKYGTAFFQHINQTGLMPPASIQRAYAGGGMVGSAPGREQAAALPAHAPVRDVININVPVTVTAADKGGNDGGKLDPVKMNELSKRFKSLIVDEIAQQQRPGGLLAGRR